jgi:glycosyltransferase involved in cell wall biosynthesis
MIRILFIANTGRIIGGGEISLLNLISSLDLSRYAPIVVVPEEGDFVDRLIVLNVNLMIIPLPSIRTIRFDRVILSIINIFMILRSQKIALIHANGSRSMLIAGLAALIARVPCIWHLRIAKKTDCLLDRILFMLSERVIAISSAVRERLSWSKKQWKIRTIPNGVDIQLFHPNNRRYRQEICRQLNINPYRPIICTISQIHPQKHLEIFIKAASHILLSVPDAQFIICGREVSESTGHQKELEKLAEALGILDTIYFVGFYSDIHKILGASDLFILSSLGEAFGRVVIEAMASGVPVIATRSGGIPDILTHKRNGFLFPPLDYKTLSQFAIDVLTHPVLSEQMTGAALDMVMMDYSTKTHVEKIQALYEEIIDCRRISS